MSAPRTERSLPMAVGEVVAERFELLEELGDGMSGRVYRARDLYVGAEPEIVALKILHRELLGDRQIAGRFKREAAILKRLSGPHLCPLVEVVDEDGLLLLALEYVDGPSLDAFLRDRGELPLAEVVGLARQVCDALESAHAIGVVHRDLKPSNVIVAGGFAAPQGSFGRELSAHVVDFGLAKIVGGESAPGTMLTERGMVFGTPEFMAPEQVAGEALSPRTDVYAAGVLAYWLLVGQLPFEHESSIATMNAQISEPPPSPRERAPDRAIPAALEAAVLRALAKEPAARFESARAFGEALAIAGAQLVSTRPPGDTQLDVDTIGTTMRSTRDSESALGRGGRVQIVVPESIGTTRPSLTPHPLAVTQPEHPSRPGRSSSPHERRGPATTRAGQAPPTSRLWTGITVAVLLGAMLLGVWLGLR